MGDEAGRYQRALEDLQARLTWVRRALVAGPAAAAVAWGGLGARGLVLGAAAGVGGFLTSAALQAALHARLRRRHGRDLVRLDDAVGRAAQALGLEYTAGTRHPSRRFAGRLHGVEVTVSLHRAWVDRSPPRRRPSGWGCATGCECTSSPAPPRRCRC